MAYETKLPRQTSSSTVTEDFSEDSEVLLTGPGCSAEELAAALQGHGWALLTPGLSQVLARAWGGCVLVASPAQSV